MRIYVLNAKKTVAFILTFGLVVSFIIFGLMNADSIDAFTAFTSKREIPIYSVERNQKELSITFDCAWGALS